MLKRPFGPSPRFLLIGPYDPECGEYTFLAPPLGVWRLAGVLGGAGLEAEVFDPNCCSGTPERELERRLAERRYDVVGVSTTGMTLRFDLSLAHLVDRHSPDSLLVAGGMEATFRPQSMFELAPFDLVVLGEGERPLLALARRLLEGRGYEGIAGTVTRNGDGKLRRTNQPALTQGELARATLATPYEQMPFAPYWERLEHAYRVGELPYKASREAKLAEIRSVRLNTLNYCPMACTFCSSTNFLHAAQGGIARLGRLDVDECLGMLKRIVAAQPAVRTVIFQDDIFVFTKDQRILPLCNAILAAKETGELPADLQFISTNRIDAMNPERLVAMRNAGFRVLGFGVESFSRDVLREFNKARIYEHIPVVLRQALELGITPFLDLILTSPRCRLADLAETVRQAHFWICAGCEVGMYPYVIPFSGAVMADDPTLGPYTESERQRIPGTDLSWDQPARILPLDPAVRSAILEIEAEFDRRRELMTAPGTHLPSRARSLLWIQAAIPVLARTGEAMPAVSELDAQIHRHLPAAAAEMELKAG